MGKIIDFKIKKKLILVLILSFIVLSPSFCLAADNLINAFGKNSLLDQAAGSKGAGYNTSGVFSVDSMISLVITMVLSFVGAIFLVLMIYGGYIWMIARGNEQEVEKAKKIIIGAIIGLVIVIAAYAISWYIINILGTAALTAPK